MKVYFDDNPWLITVKVGEILKKGKFWPNTLNHLWSKVQYGYYYSVAATYWFIFRYMDSFVIGKCYLVSRRLTGP